MYENQRRRPNGSAPKGTMSYHVECLACGSLEKARSWRCEKCGAILPPPTRRRQPERTSSSKKKKSETQYYWPKKTKKSAADKVQRTVPIVTMQVLEKEQESNDPITEQEDGGGLWN